MATRKTTSKSTAGKNTATSKDTAASKDTGASSTGASKSTTTDQGTADRKSTAATRKRGAAGPDATKARTAKPKADKPKANKARANKAAAKSRRSGSQPQTPPSRPGLVLAAAAAIGALVIAAVWYVSGESPADERGEAGGAVIEHIHGFGINPANGDLYAAAHNGLFRIPNGQASQGSQARRVGKGTQDTMGFTVAGADHFLASGHPGVGESGPANLGLIESTDGGRTWQTVSLGGEADFHALRYRHGNVYGYHAGQLMVSADRKTWRNRKQVTLRDFAVSPSDADTLVASGEQGLMRSTDGGRTWSQGDAPVLLLDWPADDELWAIGVSSDVKRSEDGGENWSVTGSVDGQVTAFAVHEKNVYVATADSEILTSTDGGKTWATIYS